MIDAFTVLYTYCYMTYNKCNSNFYVCFYQEKESILFLTKLSMKEAASKQQLTCSSVIYEPQYTHYDMTPVTLVLMLALR